MKLLNKISAWFKELKLKIKGFTNKYLPISVKVVNGVKKAIESNTFDIVVDVVKKLIKGQADDVLIDKTVKFLKKRIPQLCIELEILNATNLLHGDELLLKQALSALKNQYGEKWEQFMSGLAGDLYSYLSDGKLTKEEAKELAKSFYDEYIKK